MISPNLPNQSSAQSIDFEAARYPMDDKKHALVINPDVAGGGDRSTGLKVRNCLAEMGYCTRLLTIKMPSALIPKNQLSHYVVSQVERLCLTHGLKPEHSNPLTVISPMPKYQWQDIKQVFDILHKHVPLVRDKLVIINELAYRGSKKNNEECRSFLEGLSFNSIEDRCLGFDQSKNQIGYMRMPDQELTKIDKHYKRGIKLFCDSFNIDIDTENHTFFFSYLSSDDDISLMESILFLRNSLIEYEASLPPKKLNDSYLGKFKASVALHVHHYLQRFYSYMTGEDHQILLPGQIQERHCRPAEVQASNLSNASETLNYLFVYRNDFTAMIKHFVFVLKKLNSLNKDTVSIYHYINGTSKHIFSTPITSYPEHSANDRHINIHFINQIIPKSIFWYFIRLSTSGIMTGDNSLSEYMSIKDSLPYYEIQHWKSDFVNDLWEKAEDSGIKDLKSYYQARCTGLHVQTVIERDEKAEYYDRHIFYFEEMSADFSISTVDSNPKPRKEAVRRVREVLKRKKDFEKEFIQQDARRNIAKLFDPARLTAELGNSTPEKLTTIG